MPDRPKLGPGSGVIPGLTFFTEYQSVMKGLWDSSCLPLTGVAGTADDVEAVLDWPLDAGLVDGMKFTLTWAATNAGPMTLRLNWSGGNTPQVDVLTADGSAMGPAEALVGTRVLVEYIGGSFRVIGGGDAGAALPVYGVITASTTWMKPPGFADDAQVWVEVIGGGAGGRGGDRTSGAGNEALGGNGGGGGGYALAKYRYADVPSSVPVTIGSGGSGGAGRTGSNGSGSNGSDGGSTSFGALLSAQGGRAAGGGDNGGGPGWASVIPEPTPWFGGDGGDTSNLGNPGEASVWGGGGGGGGGGNSTSTPNPGGAGGDSIFNGNGGNGGGGRLSSRADDGEVGLAPGGGGGGGGGAWGANAGDGAAGARGEVRVWIIG